MQRHLILSEQQLLSIIELLGYKATVKEEVQYSCNPESFCEPIIVTTIQILLSRRLLPNSTENVPIIENTVHLN